MFYCDEGSNEIILVERVECAAPRTGNSLRSHNETLTPVAGVGSDLMQAGCYVE